MHACGYNGTHLVSRSLHTKDIIFKCEIFRNLCGSEICFEDCVGPAKIKYFMLYNYAD